MHTHYVILGCYFILFMVAVVGIWTWQIKRRNEKPPLEFELLRGPGESLRQRMAKFDEDIVFILGGAALAPIIAVLFTFLILIWLTPHLRLGYGVAIMAVPTLLVLFFAGRFAIRKLNRYRNDKLGYLGERAVGEALEALRADGYSVFHDVPAEVKDRKFNVDHVVVGPNGVFAIETKTRRKGRTRPGFEAHKVAYDGQQLIWPWAEDTYGLKQAQDRAHWLSEWLNKMTCLNIGAKPVLVLPGWYVIPKGIGPVIVVNHKQVAGALTRSKDSMLSDEHVVLIARQLDARCRDVTY